MNFQRPRDSTKSESDSAKEERYNSNDTFKSAFQKIGKEAAVGYILRQFPAGAQPKTLSRSSSWEVRWDIFGRVREP